MQRLGFITFLGPAAVVWKRAKRPTALLREAGYLLLGLASLATVTGLYFLLDLPLVAAAFTYLVALVLLSLVSNLSSLIVLSFIGVCCLNYFFAPPIYSFRVDLLYAVRGSRPTRGRDGYPSGAVHATDRLPPSRDSR